jgi:glycolate dehydrogenase FAD-linked subunit
LEQQSAKEREFRMTTRRELLKGLRDIVGKEHVVYRPEDLVVFEFDATIEQSTPYAVVLPISAGEIAEVVKLCRTLDVPLTPRGAGTGLSGGSVPTKRGVVLATGRMRRILEIDPVDRVAVVEPGLPNIQLSEAAAEHGLFYAPDPSSQVACSIGGNVAENAGGPHCLALGVTTNHVLGVEVVTADGDVLTLGGRVAETAGYDLRGVFIGSEGTLGIATKITVKLLPLPQTVVTMLAIFESIEQASLTVSAIIGAGLVPAALEMMDKTTLQAVEAGIQCGYPMDAGAVLLVELDGRDELVDDQVRIAHDACVAQGASEVRTAQDAKEREQLWKGRKGAIGALGRLAPNYYILDGVVPRSRLVETMNRVQEISERYGLEVANVFHAGDGNLHPCILFDQRVEGEQQRVLEAGAEVMRVCVDVGGALTGEHGVGFEKQGFMPWLYSEQDLEHMGRVKPAFGNGGLLNPCKLLPAGVGCGESINNERVVKAAGPEAYA